MNCPGPGEVLQFANEVKNRNRWRRKAQRTNGILDALAWVLGGQKKPPFLGKPTPRFPPDIETIAKVAEQAKVAVRNHPNLSYDYYNGVCECLTWIAGSRRQRPRT